MSCVNKFTEILKNTVSAVVFFFFFQKINSTTCNNATYLARLFLSHHFCCTYFAEDMVTRQLPFYNYGLLTRWAKVRDVLLSAILCLKHVNHRTNTNKNNSTNMQALLILFERALILYLLFIYNWNCNNYRISCIRKKMKLHTILLKLSLLNLNHLARPRSDCGTLGRIYARQNRLRTNILDSQYTFQWPASPLYKIHILHYAQKPSSHQKLQITFK